MKGRHVRTNILWALIACGCGLNTNDPFGGRAVVSLEDPPPPISGGTLTATEDGRYAVVADTDRDRIVVVDLTTRGVREVALAPGAEPGRVVDGGPERVYAVLRRGGAVIAIDPSSAEITARHEVCASPRGIAYEAAADRLHVACADGALVTLGATRDVERRVMLEPDLRDVVISGPNLLVSSFRSAHVTRVEISGTASPEVADLPMAELEGVDETGIGSGLVQRYAPSVGVRLVATAEGAVLLHQRARIGVEAVFEGMPPPVTYTYSNDPVSNGVVTWRDPCRNAVVHAAATFVDTRGNAMHVAPPIARGVVPIDVAVSRGGQMAIAFAGEPGGDFALGPQVVGARAALGVTDSQGCFATERDDHFEGQTIAVAFSGETRLVQVREPAQLIVGDEVIALGGASVRDTGHDLFHLDTGGAIACASCHPGGGDDGHVWAFASTRRVRTMPLEGMVGHAPYHRAGDVPSFSALMEQLSEQMAGPELAPEHLDAVEHFLRRLPEPPRGPSIDELAVERGRVIFEREDVGCASCHEGELGTDNATHYVGGQPWQTPSLRGIALRAPYLHDGRAIDLRSALRLTSDGTHGRSDLLTEDELADLEAYLRSR
jgi:mono/diheme cytochrome c family protein